MRLLLPFATICVLVSCTDSFENPKQFKRQPIAVELMDDIELHLEYDKKGLLLKETLFQRFGDPIEGVYEYDNEGRIKAVKTTVPGGINREVAYRNGEIKSIEETQLDLDSSEQLVRRFTISKYEKGRILDLSIEIPNRPRLAYSYEYLGNGNLIRLNEYSIDGHGKRSLKKYKLFTYKHRRNLLKGNFAFMHDIPTFYAQNLVLDQKCYSPDDVLLYSETYEYEYEKGEPVEMTVTGVDSAGNDSLRWMKFTF